MLRVRRLALSVLTAVVAVGCVPANPSLTTVASVDVSRYVGTWYEIASVKQFFSVGLVNTTATYTARPDGTIGVFNQGRFLSADGPLSTIEGAAIPVDGTNARLEVAFFGVAPSATGPGNYWIIDIDADYRWAAVSDPTGASFFLLSRTPTMDPALVDEIVARAAAKGVNTGAITSTPQS